MDVRGSTVASGPNPSRFLSKESSLPRHPVRGVYVRFHRRFPAPTGSVASTGDFETESNEESTNDSPQRHSRSAPEEESRKKLEVVTGLLKEGYGVGAILTAAAFRGASLTTEALKSLTQTGHAATRRQRVPRNRERSVRRQIPSILEKLQQTVSETLTATPIVWRRKNDHVANAEMNFEGGATQKEESSREQSEENAHLLENVQDEHASISHSAAAHLYESRSVVEPENEKETGTEESLVPEVEGWHEDHVDNEFKSLLGIPSEEPLSAKHISEEQMKPSAFLDVIDEGILEAVIPEEVLSTESDAEERQQETVSEFTETAMQDIADNDVLDELIEEQQASDNRDVVDTLQEDSVEEVSTQAEDYKLDEVILENNVEAFGSLGVEEENCAHEESSVVVHRAKEILDEIANFEIETGESVDSADEEQVLEEPILQPAEKSKAESEQELKEQMRMESERRLRAMKIGSAAQQQRESPVKVERAPSQKEKIVPPAASVPSTPSMSPPTQKFRGLDYIKNYAKESRHASGDSAKDSSSSFFTPPSILQETRKTQATQAASTSTRGYNQWREVDRLKRIREIGTMMWLGHGGNGGNGGDGDSGGGGGRSGDNSDDKHWWIQVLLLTPLFSLVCVFSL